MFASLPLQESLKAKVHVILVALFLIIFFNYFFIWLFFYLIILFTIAMIFQTVHLLLKLWTHDIRRTSDWDRVVALINFSHPHYVKTGSWSALLPGYSRGAIIRSLVTNIWASILNSARRIFGWIAVGMTGHSSSLFYRTLFLRSHFDLCIIRFCIFLHRIVAIYPVWWRNEFLIKCSMLIGCT